MCVCVCVSARAILNIGLDLQGRVVVNLVQPLGSCTDLKTSVALLSFIFFIYAGVVIYLFIFMCIRCCSRFQGAVAK